MNKSGVFCGDVLTCTYTRSPSNGFNGHHWQLDTCCSSTRIYTYTNDSPRGNRTLVADQYGFMD